MILFLDNQSSIGPDAAPGQFGRQGPQREPRARNPGTAHARRRLRLRPGGRHRVCARSDRLERRRAGQRGGRARRVRLQAQLARAGRAHDSRQDLRRGRRRAGDARSSTISRAIRRRRAISRRSSCATSSPTTLRPISSTRWRQEFRDSDGDLAVVASALVADDRAWRAEAGARSARRSNSSSAPRARPAFSRPIRRSTSRRSTCSACRCGSPRGPNGFSDSSDAWASPEGMKIAARPRLVHGPAHADVAEPLVRPDDRRSAKRRPRKRARPIERAESREQALALLFMAPEFQRR